MRGHKRFKDAAWRLVVDAGKDPITGKRRQVNRTVRAPNTRAGAQAADVDLARLVVEVTSGEATPSAHITVGELLVESSTACGVAEKTTKAGCRLRHRSGLGDGRGSTCPPQAVCRASAGRRSVTTADRVRVRQAHGARRFGRLDALGGLLRVRPPAKQGRWRRGRPSTRPAPLARNVHVPDGFDPVTVAGRGGWSSPTVPMNVYGHFAPARDQAAAASLAQRLAVAEGTAGGDGGRQSAPGPG